MSGTPGRLLSLLSLLQARRDWPGHLLAERLDVSPRTVRRDVDRLGELGYPVQATMGPDGGYCLVAGADVPPLLFDDEQAVALAVALQVAAVSGAGTSDGAWRALATVRQVLPPRMRHRVDALEVLRFDYPSAVPGPSDGASTTRVPPPPRRVRPHHVLARGGRWYLLAWDLDRQDWRTFRLDRMTPRAPSGPPFTPRAIPGGDPVRFVSALFTGAHDPAEGDTWPCQGQVVLHTAAEKVAPYAGDATVEPLGANRCRVSLGAWSWTGVAASLARFDADIELIGPPELAQAFTDLARRCTDAATSLLSRNDATTHP